MSKVQLNAVLAILICMASCARRNDSKNDQQFKTNVQYLTSGKYQQAIAGFKKLENTGCKTAALYNNIGLCYYNTGNMSMAVLYDEKGLALSPFDEQLNDNLSIVLKKLNRSVLVNNISYNDNNRNTLFIFQSVIEFLTVALLICSIVFVLIKYRQVNRYKKVNSILKIWLHTLGLLLITSCLLLSNYRAQKYIVILKNSAMRLGPAKNAKANTVLRQGYKVKETNYYNGWYKVQDNAQTSGWVFEGDLALIN
jgi:tetratricopeptide (TPR) repeat protein